MAERRNAKEDTTDTAEHLTSILDPLTPTRCTKTTSTAPNLVDSECCSMTTVAPDTEVSLSNLFELADEMAEVIPEDVSKILVGEVSSTTCTDELDMDVSLWRRHQENEAINAKLNELEQVVASDSSTCSTPTRDNLHISGLDVEPQSPAPVGVDEYGFAKVQVTSPVTIMSTPFVFGPPIESEQQAEPATQRQKSSSSSRRRMMASRAPKTYSQPIPSRHCHICTRSTARGHGHVVCKNMQRGLCRKTVCQRCFIDQGWNWTQAVQYMSEWICPHCIGRCPQRAQCHIYNRTNGKRKRQMKHQAAMSASSKILDMSLDKSIQKVKGCTILEAQRRVKFSEKCVDDLLSSLTNPDKNVSPSAVATSMLMSTGNDGIAHKREDELVDTSMEVCTDPLVPDLTLQ